MNNQQILEPLQYHRDICQHLKEQEKGLWTWFASDEFTQKHVEYQKLELLKSTIRLNPENSPHLYELAERARDALQIELPLTLYQAQSSVEGLNAALLFLPDDIAIILQGDITEKLADEELLAVFSHEIAHHKLYTIEQGDYFIAMRLLHWCCTQPDCHAAFYESDRRYQLFTEVYADLGALQVTGQWESAVSSLIKVSTGLKQVSVDDYLIQADEVLAQLESGSKGISHPETFLRTKILHSVKEAIETDSQWYTNISRLIVGQMDATCLDLLDQRSLSDLSETLIKKILSNPVMRTDTLEALAQQYYPELITNEILTPTSGAIDSFISVVENSKTKTLDYLSYILLDFATADQDVQPVSLIITLQIAEELKLGKVFESIARKELKKKKNDINKLLDDAQEKIDEANNAHIQ